MPYHNGLKGTSPDPAIGTRVDGLGGKIHTHAVLTGGVTEKPPEIEGGRPKDILKSRHTTWWQEESRFGLPLAAFQAESSQPRKGNQVIKASQHQTTIRNSLSIRIGEEHKQFGIR